MTVTKNPQSVRPLIRRNVIPREPWHKGVKTERCAALFAAELGILMSCHRVLPRLCGARISWKRTSNFKNWTSLDAVTIAWSTPVTLLQCTLRWPISRPQYLVCLPIFRMWQRQAVVARCHSCHILALDGTIVSRANLCSITGE